MKKYLMIAILTVAEMFMASAADEGAKADKPAVAPVTQLPSTAEIMETKILKVYSAESKGARFRAYLIKWNDAEVIVNDIMGNSDRKEGDMIKVLVQRMELPDRGNILQFMLIDIPNAPAAKPDMPAGK